MPQGDWPGTSILVDDWFGNVCFDECLFWYNVFPGKRLSISNVITFHHSSKVVPTWRFVFECFLRGKRFPSILCLPCCLTPTAWVRHNYLKLTKHGWRILPLGSGIGVVVGRGVVGAGVGLGVSGSVANRDQKLLQVYRTTEYGFISVLVTGFLLT